MRRFWRRAVRAMGLLIRDPRAFWTRLTTPAPIGDPPGRRRRRVRRIDLDGVLFDVDLDLDPRMRSMVRGTYQPEITALLRRLLRTGDVFIDVGANIGYLSAVGLSRVGPTGEVHAFEPVPRYLERLRRMADLNPSYQLRVNGSALGERPGTAPIAVTRLANIGWNTMVPGFMPADHLGETIEVAVTTLDEYVAGRPVERLRLVKIDTEGFEFPVLRGFADTLREHPAPPFLIVEIAPGAYARLGTSLADLVDFTLDLGYAASDVTLTRPVNVMELERTTDVVFVPRGWGMISATGATAPGRTRV
jgi:FkbM family methyltransferase